MEATVLAIQQLYPQVFHACHVAHARARSNAFRLSERDGGILAHVGWVTTARELGAHLGIGAPAMSTALQRLERLGYIARAPRTPKSPARPLQLTELGRRAMQSASVLDSGRLGALLATLTGRDRRRAVLGLELLARGARSLAGVEVRS